MAPTVLHLTNNLTSGAIPHLLSDVGPHLSDRYDLHAGALLGGDSDRVSRGTLRELSSSGVDPHRFRFDTEPFYVAAREFYGALADVDVLHTHLVRSGVFGRMFGALAGVPAIVSSEHRDHRKYTPKQSVANALTLRLADQIVCVSESVCSSFSSWERAWLSATDRAVVYNGVDPETIRAADEEDVPDDLAPLARGSPVVGTVGRVVPEKNHEILVRALPRVQERFPEAELVVVGDGPLAGQLRALSETLDVSDSVTVTGWLGREATLSLLHTFDLFAMPSTSEGFGMAVLEAMFASTPLLLSDIDVFHEVGGDAARYAGSGPDEWAGEIVAALDDPEGLAANARQSYERAAEKFTPEAIADGFDRLYSEALTKRVPE